MPMKYVMLKTESSTLIPLLFPEVIQHSHMAQSGPATDVSAGRASLEDGKAVVRSSSSSLNVSSRELDSQIIQT